MCKCSINLVKFQSDVHALGCCNIVEILCKILIFCVLIFYF